jgi:hypothetical protein
MGIMGKEHLLTKATTKQRGLCQVRSKTEHPCTHQATVEFHGIPFCEQCVREQEAYFDIGELETRAQGPASERELEGRIAEAGERLGHFYRSNPPYGAAGVHQR